MDRAPDDEARQRRLEQALQGSEERFRRLVEAAKDYAIFTADVDGRVSTWNEGAARVFGYEEERSSAWMGPSSSPRRTVRVVPPSGNCRKPEPRAGPRTSAGTCARTDRASGPAASSGPC